MTSRSIEIVHCRGRYYLHPQCQFAHFHNPRTCGNNILADLGLVPGPEEYKEWLVQTRASYAARERKLEEHVYEIRDDYRPSYSCGRNLLAIPSEIPLLGGYNLGLSRLVNLDREVLTVGFSAHWKLSSIPRSGNLICLSRQPYPYVPFSSPEGSLDESIASPALSPVLELPEPNPSLGYRHHIVAPRLDISEARKAFLTRVVAEVLVKYKECIIMLGPEWSPASFPFREFSFALVSIASGMNKFFSFPAQSCNPRGCHREICHNRHLPLSWGFLDGKWAGSHAPLLEFGTMSHRQGDAPGASPAETMYWLEGVLVSLSLMNDGEAVRQAISWGREQGRQSFQIVVLSLFQVTFAEVSVARGDNVEPLVKVSDPIYLSPLRRYCIHSRDQPEQEGRPSLEDQRHEVLREMMTCPEGVQELQSQFPGVAALVNFFEVAANRRAASRTRGIFPVELYDEILEYVDYDTWKTCASVSTDLRFSCLRKYRVDEKTRILGGPVIQSPEFPENRLLSFEFENLQTGQILPAISTCCHRRTKELNWMPLIGIDRKALMLHVVVQFETAEDIAF
ncbi:hypothetical protein F4678DRAFT_484202 [Xylaria arbuscula]|nr:hypothetical protein F4678DRAFT_484202 [Xylaria arbuscula]